MTERVRWAVVPVMLAAVACAPVGARPHASSRPGASGAVVDDPTPPPSAFDAGVVRVVDGDTFIARLPGRARTERVRVIGVDAPESVAPDRPVGCYGPQASAEAKRLLPKGTRVRVAPEPGGDRDRYSRLLWDVWLPDGRLLPATLVRAGAARADPARPQTTYAALLASLEREARDERRGLWGACRA